MARSEVRCNAAERILAALDAEPALIEHYDTSAIEALPLSDIRNRLDDLGLPSSIPFDLRKLIVESSTPAGALLEALSSNPEQPRDIIGKKPLEEVAADLQELGINYRHGLAEVIALTQQYSGAAEGPRQATAFRRLVRRPVTRYAASALLGAAAASLLMLLANPSLYDHRRIADAGASRTATPEDLEKIATVHPNSAVGAQANDTQATDLGIVRALLTLAERNDPQAQFVLGLLYATGRGGVEKDYQKSVDWWTRAAELGSSEAKEALSLATVFRDEGQLPQKWANLVTFIAKDKALLENLPPQEMVAKITAMANATINVVVVSAPNSDASDLSAEREWATLKDSVNFAALRAFSAKFRNNFYGEQALNRVTTQLRYTSAFYSEVDEACKVASSYPLDDDSRRIVRVWSLPTGALARTFSMSSRVAHAVLLDGLIAVSEEKQVTLFDLQTGSIKKSLPLEHKALIASEDRRKLLLDEPVSFASDIERIIGALRLSDGTLVQRRPDGTLVERRPDGTLVEREADRLRVLDVDTDEIQSIPPKAVRISSRNNSHCNGTSGSTRQFSTLQ